MDQIPQQPSSNPYDFITNPEKPKKIPKLGGNSTRSRVLVVLGGLILLVIIASVVSTIISSAGNADVKAFKDLAAQQQELIRIAAIGVDKGQSTDVRSFAITTQYGLTTQQQNLAAYLSGRGVSMTKEELAVKKKESVDKALDTAASNNHFDEEFTATMTEALTKYSASTKSAYQTTSSEKAKAILSDSYTSSTTLLGIKD